MIMHGNSAVVKSKVTSRKYYMFQVDVAGARIPNQIPYGFLQSLSGAAAWRPLGDVILTLNPYLEGH